MSRTAAVVICLLLAASAHADSWVSATVQARASNNGQFVVRVIPGKSMGDVYGFGGTAKGRYSTAEWHRFDGTSYKKVRTVTLLNPVAPVDIELTDQGLLVTIDNWHNLGRGYVLVIYSPNGEVVRKFALSDLYSAEEIARIRTSASSIRWRCPGSSTSLESETELWVDDSMGGRFVFKLDTGAFTYQRGGGSC